jgi:predicted O-linked N-acetylglucosamine transferase (SPINDLY family)
VFSESRSRNAAAFVEALFARHDRARFHVTAYPNTARSNPATDRVRKLADAWKPLAGLSDDAAAEQIRADEIDLLIDLCGHTAGNRLLVFARKPARVQMTLAGYPSTTGLKAIDYRITDALADPPGVSDSFGTEKLLRLPTVGRVYVPPAGSPEPNALPARTRRVFTFGCLCNPAKLSDACIDSWAEVLKAVPLSRLVLPAGRSVQAARQLAERFSRLGVVPDRLELVYRLPENEYLQAYQPIDLALDPFPFNGRTTTCDALWMGVPVLSLAGADSRGRQGMSILTNLGVPDFVADDLDRFVELAATWADQREGLAELRADLRGMMAASPVTDVAAYVRDLEGAYLTALGLGDATVPAGGRR